MHFCLQHLIKINFTVAAIMTQPRAKIKSNRHSAVRPTALVIIIIIITTASIILFIGLKPAGFRSQHYVLMC